MDNIPYPLTTDYPAMFVLVMQGKRLAAFVTKLPNGTGAIFHYPFSDFLIVN